MLSTKKATNLIFHVSLKNHCGKTNFDFDWRYKIKLKHYLLNENICRNELLLFFYSALLSISEIRPKTHSRLLKLLLFPPWNHKSSVTRKEMALRSVPKHPIVSFSPKMTVFVFSWIYLVTIKNGDCGSGLLIEQYNEKSSDLS